MTATTETHWKTASGEPVIYSETWVQCETCFDTELRPEFGEGPWAMVARSAAVPPGCQRIDKDEYVHLVAKRDQQFTETVASRTATEMKAET